MKRFAFTITGGSIAHNNSAQRPVTDVAASEITNFYKVKIVKP